MPYNPLPFPLMFAAFTLAIVTIPRKTGDVLSTRRPDPVTVDTPVPPRATPRIPVVTFCASIFVSNAPFPMMVELELPNTPATRFPSTVTFPGKIGDVSNTTFPVPVFVDTPVPPLTSGRTPNALARLMLVNAAPFPTNALAVTVLSIANVPKTFPATVIFLKMGAVFNTTLPLPVDVVTPVPPWSTCTMPLIGPPPPDVRSTWTLSRYTYVTVDFCAAKHPISPALPDIDGPISTSLTTILLETRTVFHPGARASPEGILMPPGIWTEFASGPEK